MHWSIEAKDAAITLRDEKRAPWVYVSRSHTEFGFRATVLIPKMPSSGPYKSREEAAEWGQRMVTMHVYPDATFAPIPEMTR